MKVMKRNNRYENGARKERNGTHQHRNNVQYTRTFAQTVGGGALVFGSYDKIMNRNITHHARQHNNSRNRSQREPRGTLVRVTSSDVGARSNNNESDD